MKALKLALASLFMMAAPLAHAQGVIWVYPVVTTVAVVPAQTVVSCVQNTSNFQVGFSAQVDGNVGAVNITLPPQGTIAITGYLTNVFGQLPNVTLTYADLLDGGERAYVLNSYLVTPATVNPWGQVNCAAAPGGYFYQQVDPVTGRVGLEFTRSNQILFPTQPQ